MRDKGRAGQQEMVGFVLIVVLVVVGLMVFLVISLRGGTGDTDSLEVSNMLSAIMGDTTGCAIVFEPQYDTFEDLFKSCHMGDSCDNLGKSACNYLNESLRGVLKDIMKSEATVQAYQLDFVIRDEGAEEGLLRIAEGNCTGEVAGASRSIVSGAENLLIKMKVCRSLG